jgi:hypothetical protein
MGRPPALWVDDPYVLAALDAPSVGAADEGRFLVDPYQELPGSPFGEPALDNPGRPLFDPVEVRQHDEAFRT